MGSLPPPTTQPKGHARSWHRDNFFLTTDKTCLDPDAVNAAFHSDLMWWNDPLEPGQMRKMLDNCLTLALFHVSETEEEMKRENGTPPHARQFIGLARIITDHVTFAYLTDVFIAHEFQGRGLASWMMRAVKELVDEWPNLRGLMLMAHDRAAARLYGRTLGAVEFDEGPSAGMLVLEMGGRGQKGVPGGGEPFMKREGGR